MSTDSDQKKLRPYSADVARLTKVRLQSSNCPTILKHEVINNTPEAFQPFNSVSGSERQGLIDRPRTANNASKMKFSFMQNPRSMASPVSAGSFRPQSGGMNSTINFDFLAGMGKTNSQGKFKDRSKIKPVKKLNTDQFHNVIYKVKHQKELLEQEINRMEQWHKDFKENDVWSTPQTAIIDSILKMNARVNPEGHVGRYLQNEKEKEEELRMSKKSFRPASSAGFLARKTPSNAKSVKDFFIAEDDGEEMIEEILTSKPYHRNYGTNKLKIADRIQSYVDNMDNYHTLIDSTKNMILREEEQPREQVPKAYRHLEKSLKESKDISAYSAALQDQGNSISEMVESAYENSEADQSANYKAPRVKSAFNQTMQARPMSANVAISTAFSPKNFGNTISGSTSATTKPFFSQKGPVMMHNRPQTAKATRVAPSLALANNMSATGEAKQSISSIKFVPIMMEGQKINVDPYNRMVNKSKEYAAITRKTQYQDEEEVMSLNSDHKGRVNTKGQAGLVNSSFKSISMLKEESDRGSQRGGHIRFVQRKLVSAKAHHKSSSGTQTLVQENPPAVGKVNIDGEYFQNYSGSHHSRTPNRPNKVQKYSRKDILESWITKENQPMAQYAQEAEIF